MARPLKQTVDYFPHDSHASDSKTLFILESKFGNDGYAFYPDSPTHHITPRTIQRIIKKASFQAFGREIHPHVLRHTFASRLMRTTNIRIVQQLLGHKSIQSTQIYTHPNHDDLTTAIKSLED